MLQGGPPVGINHMDDLAKLPDFFDNPRKFFDKTWLDQAPGLSRVIARMLCKDPRDRWGSMSAVLDAIEPLQRSQHRQEVHVGDAKQSYCRYCRGRPAFYSTFYTMFFRRSPTTEGLFARVSMDRQYQMIDEAIEKLLNFRDGAEPTTLSRTREAHRRFQLGPADFDHFRDAFLEALEAMGEHDPEVLELLVCGTQAGRRLHEAGVWPKAPAQTRAGAQVIVQGCRRNPAAAASPARRRRRQSPRLRNARARPTLFASWPLCAMSLAALEEGSRDRPVHMEHAERAQDFDHAGRDRAALRGSSDQHRPGGPIQAGVPGNQPEQQDSGHRRPGQWLQDVRSRARS